MPHRLSLPPSLQPQGAGMYRRSCCPSVSQTHHGLQITAGEILWELQELWADLSLHRHQHQQDEPHHWQLVQAVLTSGALHWPECEVNVTNAALLPSESYQNVSYKPGAMELRGEDSPGKCRSSSVKLWPFISTTEAHSPSHAQVSHPTLSSTWMSSIMYLFGVLLSFLNPASPVAGLKPSPWGPALPWRPGPTQGRCTVWKTSCHDSRFWALLISQEPAGSSVASGGPWLCDWCQ